MIEYSQENDKIIKAMIAVQKELPAIKKSKKAYNYDYIPLDDILDVLKPLLNKNNLIMVQNYNVIAGSMVEIKTYLFHESGQAMLLTGCIPINNNKNVTQDAGAAITYGKRYQISALFGIASDEDTDAVEQPKEQKYKNRYQVEKNETVNPKKADDKKKQLVKEMVEIVQNKLFTDEDRIKWKEKLSACTTVPHYESLKEIYEGMLIEKEMNNPVDISIDEKKPESKEELQLF